MGKAHIPVLLSEVVGAFMEQTRAPLRFFDGTFGRGGHTKELLKKFPRSQVVAFDRDSQAIEYAQKEFEDELKSGRLTLVHDDFRNLGDHNLGLFDGALFDLGVSSPQFDQPDRGFSFSFDGPLDMRMDRNQKITAEKIINEATEKELIDIFRILGEVRKPERVVRAIVHDRDETPFKTTKQLASLIERVDRPKVQKRRFGRERRAQPRKTNPATNYFMALRIAVNEELDDLDQFLRELHLSMEPGSRVAVISFHSLEDRIVKNVFKDLHKKHGKTVTRKIIVPSDNEVKKNIRARSAKMRIFEMGV